MSDYYTLSRKHYKDIDGRRYYRVKATKDFKNPYRDVKKGELSGYLCSVCMEGNSWVFGNAIVFDCVISYNSYIVGDFQYHCLKLSNGSIQGTCNYINAYGYNRIYDNDVVGNNFIKGSKHSVIWGVDNKTKEIRIMVGCQNHSIPQWKTYYRNISNREGYNYFIDEYLGYLKTIEDSLKPSNEKVLEKISENVSKLKSQVTEELKSETISLVTSLKVPEKVLEKSGPKRCPKTGRWLKKNP